MTTITEPRQAAHRGDLENPRWAVIAAHLVPLVVLPSSLWRIAIACGLDLGWSGAPLAELHSASGRAYIVALSVGSEALALLTLGLVQRWGEVVPRWVPVVGSRRIPTWLVALPAAAGGLAVTAMTVMMTYNWFQPESFDLDGAPRGGWHLLIAFAYAPLLLWGPLLLAVTYAYLRRRLR